MAITVKPLVWTNNPFYDNRLDAKGIKDFLYVYWRSHLYIYKNQKPQQPITGNEDECKRLAQDHHNCEVMAMIHNLCEVSWESPNGGLD